MDKSLDPRFGPYRLGQVVLSRRGKDRGSRYVVVGFPEEDRLALADADRFNVSRPKRKNPKHVQPTSLFATGSPSGYGRAGTLTGGAFVRS